MSEEGEKKKMLKAEVLFCIENEMTCTPTDFFMRRTGRLFFAIQSVFLYKENVTEVFKIAVSWAEQTTEVHQQELEEKIKIATTFE
jgi:glycerol-3-phosphate dehydrogenase